ncbi:MAG TPA: transposase [Thermoanaerobaculia bacterium]|nr:transposase [Thermoanaerobaculia bacterium]
MIVDRRSYRRHLPHFQSDSRTYFVTFIAKDRRVLPDVARDAAMRHIVFDHQRRMWLHAAVVMPDHAHILITPLYDRSGWSYALSTILQGIKGSSARSINAALQTKGAVWQHESFDHELRREENLRKTAEYIAHNPVRKGLCTSPDQYRWLWREWLEGQKTASET